MRDKLFKNRLESRSKLEEPIERADLELKMNHLNFRFNELFKSLKIIESNEDWHIGWGSHLRLTGDIPSYGVTENALY